MKNPFVRLSTVLVIVLLCALPASLGCGGGGGGTACPAGTGTGTLSLTITGILIGPADVTVGTRSVTASTYFDLPVGPHEITISPVAVLVGVFDTVREAYGVRTPVQTVCVRAGKSTEVPIDYLPIPTSKKVWIGTSAAPASATMVGFNLATVASSGNRPADRVTNTAGSGGFAFDRHGNLWVIGATTADPPLARYPATTFSTGGDKLPDVTIDGSSSFGDVIPGPVAMAFDPNGNLWVAAQGANRVVKFTAAQVGIGGTPTAVVEQGGIPAPAAIAFDGTGNLWVAALDGPSVMRIDAARLDTTASGADLTITAVTSGAVMTTLGSPLGLAFDASGNLWVNYDGVIAKLTPSDLAGTGVNNAKTVTPTVQLTTDALALPSGLAFDELGGLWLGYGAMKIARLDASQLLASGTVTPNVLLTSADLGAVGWPGIYPAPSGLPLYHRLP